MVAMVASASGYGTLRRFLSMPEGQHSVPEAGVMPTTSVAVSSKQRASIKWLLSKAFNNRVPDNLQEPFYRDHEDQEHLKPPIVGGLANAELYCLALANMYSDPNYHSLNHWNILQTLARKGVHVPDPPDCALTETVLIQTNPLKLSAHMSVIESVMVLYAREVVTSDRVAAAAQRFGSAPPQIQHHEDGILCWINAACTALNKAEEDSSSHVPMLKSLQEVCDGTALAALISFYCPDTVPRSAVRVGRMASIQDCLHNLMLVHEFCRTALPHNVFHMMPEDVTYMRGSMRQNLVAMLADLFNMLEVHPVKSVKCPTSVPRSPSSLSGRARARRSASSTPERRSASPAPDDYVVHRQRHVATLAAMARRDDDNELAMPATAAGRPSNWADTRDATFAGRRSRRSSISDDSQLTVENFGGSQDRLHFAGRNPEKELATLANVRKISAPAGPLDYNPPLRSSRQDIRGSIQFFHGDFHNGSGNERQKVERQHSQPDNEHFIPIRRQLSSDTITLSERSQNFGFSAKGGGDGFYLNDRDSTDGDVTKTSFADVNKIRSNGDPTGIQSVLSKEEPIERRKSTTFVTPPSNTTTWQQQFMQQEHQPNGEDLTDERTNSPSGGQMAAQLNNIRLKLEEKRRRIEQEKRRMEMAVNRQRQQLGQQAFLQAVTRDAYLQYQLASLGKGARTPVEEEPKHEPAPHQEMVVEPPSQRDSVDNVVLEQYQQSIAKMNSSLQDIQSDIARLASQQTQIQQQQQQQQMHQQQPQQILQQQQQQAKQLFQQQPPMQQPPQPPQSPYQQQHYQPNIPQLHSQFSSQHNVSRPGLTSFGSTPHIPQQQYYNYEQQQQQQQQQQQYQHPYQYRDIEDYGRQQFYLHDATPPPAPRRTWAQHAQQQQIQQDNELRGWQLHQQNHQQYAQLPPEHQPQPQRTWKAPSPQPPPDRNWQPQGFVLHERNTPNTQPFPVHHYNNDRYQNGTESRETQNHLSYTVINPNQYVSPSPPLAASPQRRANTPQRQGSLSEVSRRSEPVSLQQLQTTHVPTHTPSHTPTHAPPPDDMEPQNISFIGNAEDDALRQGINRLNISSGTRTYRIPSPTRPSLSRNSFQHLEQEEANEQNEKGFYISFDNDQPKRPKPPLRAKRSSPKKERSTEYQSPDRSPETTWNERLPQPEEEEFVVHRSTGLEQTIRSNDVSERRETPPRERPQRVNNAEPAALVIGEMNPDPNSAEEMERKKERIMMLSLQRRQRADEARARADAAAAARKAREEQANEQKLARKEEQARRREQILRQYKLKKAIEEADREGKVLDKSEFLESLKVGNSSPAPTPTTTTARLRGKAGGGRARPKTIHVDSSALHAAEGMLTTKQPSSTNLTAGGTMRRDYYRGSQDSLAERAGLYRESPVEDRGGMSPSSASSGPLGRRGSCKTSRERVNEEPQTTRGRSKYSTYGSNFKAGRKSSSLMNLCDSGLGRATPPRRAASPGVRALTSPAGAHSAPSSGPGSLPGAIGKRRHHPDDASDVSSTHSSIMDYSGPRLYKQPATKSNRGIMLNAVEYCVFPGAVNAEAKRRVLEEIARSESKHFLVLFRDAGCQFRALYSYCPDSEQVTKLYGTGPKHVNDRMFDKFFKYNSGSKCFSQVHTKHLTVTIDAFTIHNSLWQGKKVQLPSKKDMALVI